MSAPDRFIAWCKQEQASLQQQLELLEASKVLTGEKLRDGSLYDVPFCRPRFDTSPGRASLGLVDAFF